MLFNSLQYFLFFSLVLAAYWSLSNNPARLRLLVVASLFFYATWNPPFVLLLFVSIGVDYFCSHRIAQDPGRKKLYVTLSACTNLGILAAFKYGDFLLENIGAAAVGLGFSSAQHEPLGLVLPLGISFYTFQTMSYTIDVYRGRQAPIQSIWTFATYVTFFPQLVAGPIVRASEFESQLDTARTFEAQNTYAGASRILMGLIKKVIIADWLAAAIVEPVFFEPENFSGLQNLIAVYAYAFQILCDFSGYVDIALGSALLLGYKLPENFNAPYLASNMTDFWRRWHMTLSNWLRDYLYIPLGGNRGSKWLTYRNLMLTMLLGGLWHGASWNFVTWGAIHGFLLAAHRLWSRSQSRDGKNAARDPRMGRFQRLAGVVVTFNLACFAWIFFRCQSFGEALIVIARIASLGSTPELSDGVIALCLSPAVLCVYAACVWLARQASRWRPRSPMQELVYGSIAGGLLLLLALYPAPSAEFIYFRF